MNEIDEALIRFEELKKKLEVWRHEDLSESDNRSKVIDFIFLSILGWQEEDIRREGSADGKFFDYHFQNKGISFIVEAKRQSVAFTIPNKIRTASLNTLYRGKNKEVIDQIRQYLQSKSITSGIITNGNQFIISNFVNTDGIDWRKNEAHFFKDFDDIENNFIVFYNMLSRSAVLERKSLVFPKQTYHPKCLRDTLRRSDEMILRNDFSTRLGSVIQSAFEELVDDDDAFRVDLLERCYVKNNDIKKYSGDLESVLMDVSPKFDDRIVNVKPLESLTEKIDSAVELNSIKRNAPILVLIGGSGAGKTSFIKYYFEIEQSKELKNRSPSLYIDFRGRTSQEIADTDSICNELLNKLSEKHPEFKLNDRDTLEHIYKKDLDKHYNGLWKNITSMDVIEEKAVALIEKSMHNSINHLTIVARYLQKELGKHLCLAIDNVDQLDNHAQDIAFELAASLNHRMGCTSIVALREGYFLQRKNKAPFDAFHVSIFHISAPSFSEVISKRLDYVITKLNASGSKGNIKGRSFEFTEEGFKALFRNLKSSIIDNNQQEILRFLEESSVPSVRNCLLKIKQFLVSGHTDISSYLTESRNIPVWEFIRPIALGSNRYYRSEGSLVFNLFKPSKGNTCHFIKSYLLEYLLIESGGGLISEVSFINVEDIIKAFEHVGYSEGEILSSLLELLNATLINSSSYSTDTKEDEIINKSSNIFLTHAGNYYLNNFLQMFVYSELTMHDTPIFKAEYYTRMKDSVPEYDDINGKRDLEGSFNTVLIFHEYLEACEVESDVTSRGDDVHNCFKKSIVNNRIRTDTMDIHLEKLRKVIARKYELPKNA